MRPKKLNDDRFDDLEKLWEDLGRKPPGAILTIPPRYRNSTKSVKRKTPAK
jgi:hypothetical protein